MVTFCAEDRLCAHNHPNIQAVDCCPEALALFSMGLPGFNLLRNSNVRTWPDWETMLQQWDTRKRTALGNPQLLSQAAAVVVECTAVVARSDVTSFSPVLTSIERIIPKLTGVFRHFRTIIS